MLHMIKLYDYKNIGDTLFIIYNHFKIQSFLSIVECRLKNKGMQKEKASNVGPIRPISE